MMSEGYLRDLLMQAAKAHHLFEEQVGKTDDNWPAWYANHMLTQMRRDFGYSPKNPLGV